MAKENMKWYFKMLIVILAVFLLAPLLKNIYLYYSYHHGDKALVNDGHTWNGIFDIHHDGLDTHVELKLKLFNDTSGFLTFVAFGKKNDGEKAETYSWRSLLSYQKKSTDTIKLNVRLDSIYMYGTKQIKDYPFEFCSIYKISNDSMYISYLPLRYKGKLNKSSINDINWGYGDSWKAWNLFDIIMKNPFKKWEHLFKEIK